MQLAQRYPTAYDGIAAGAPGLYTSRTFPAMFWSQQVMNVLGRYPYGCEVDALTAAAVEACDGLDGVVDGIVADPDACLGVFDPFPLIGTAVEECVQAGNGTVEISTAAAVVVNATWHGIVTATGEKTWYGFSPGTNLVDAGGIPGVAATDCSGGECVGVPGGLGPPWFEQFLAKGHPDFEVGTLSYEEFDDLVHYGRQVYRAAIDTDDPDLSRFRDAGGKMVSWHGLVSAVRFHNFWSRSHKLPVGHPRSTQSNGALLRRSDGIASGGSRLLPPLRGPRPRPLHGWKEWPAKRPFRAAPCLGRERHGTRSHPRQCHCPGRNHAAPHSLPVPSDGEVR